MIYFLTYNVTQGQTPIGKYPLPNGQLFFIALTWVNLLEKLQVIMAYPMKQYGVLFVPLEINRKPDNFLFLEYSICPIRWNI